MKLAPAPDRYDVQRQSALQSELTREDNRNRKKGEHIELVSEFLILRSPDGSRFKLTVSNAGALSAVAL